MHSVIAFHWFFPDRSRLSTSLLRPSSHLPLLILPPYSLAARTTPPGLAGKSMGRPRPSRFSSSSATCSHPIPHTSYNWVPPVLFPCRETPAALRFLSALLTDNIKAKGRGLRVCPQGIILRDFCLFVLVWFGVFGSTGF
jgi:hypothetical protein